MTPRLRPLNSQATASALQPLAYGASTATSRLGNGKLVVGTGGSGVGRPPKKQRGRPPGGAKGTAAVLPPMAHDAQTATSRLAASRRPEEPASQGGEGHCCHAPPPVAQRPDCDLLTCCLRRSHQSRRRKSRRGGGNLIIKKLTLQGVTQRIKWEGGVAMSQWWWRPALDRDGG